MDEELDHLLPYFLVAAWLVSELSNLLLDFGAGIILLITRAFMVICLLLAAGARGNLYLIVEISG